MLLANFNRKEHVRHRAVSLRQHGFLVLVEIGLFLHILPTYLRYYIILKPFGYATSPLCEWWSVGCASVSADNNQRTTFVRYAAAATWNSLPVPDSLKYTRPTRFQNHLKKISSLVYFLADRTNGRAIGTVLRLSSSVWNVMHCG